MQAHSRTRDCGTSSFGCRDNNSFAGRAGCMAALQAEHFLTAHEVLDDRTAEAATADDDAKTAQVVHATENLSTEAVALANGHKAKEEAAKNPVPS